MNVDDVRTPAAEPPADKKSASPLPTVTGRMIRRLLVAYCRAELPAWGRFRQHTRNCMERWVNSLPTTSVTICGKRHGYEMNLDLSDPWDRLTYLLGRFVELESELLMERVLRAGDTVIDVGANRGMFTLSCARLVGVTGRVHAFEPNPREMRRTKELVTSNSLTQVTSHETALANCDGQMTLRLLDDRSGLSTLATLESTAQQRITGSIEVAVRRGDDVLGPQLAGPVLIKVDVEGFECEVLRGFAHTVERLQPALYVEVEPLWLKRAGTTDTELIELIQSRGYRVYKVWTRRAGLRRRLELTAVSSAQQLESLRRQHGPTHRNILAVHPDSVCAARMQP